MPLERCDVKPGPAAELDAGGAEPRDADMARSIGRVLRDMRKQQGLSLSELSESAGVSTSMLSQIENGRSTPTVAVLWKIAKTFQVPLPRFLEDFEAVGRATLMRRQDAPVRSSRQGQCVWRNLKPAHLPQRIGFYEVTLKGQASEDVPASGERAWINLAVAKGEAVVALGGRRYPLRQGDTLEFPSDLAHTLINPTREDAVLFLVTSRGPAESAA